MKSGVPHHIGSGFIVIPYTTSTTGKKGGNKVQLLNHWWMYLSHTLRSSSSVHALENAN